MPTPAIQAIIRGAPIRIVISGGPGPGGKSAYQIAVENGFVGTEEEWLESLVGAAGPNEVTSATTTDFPTGQILYANGANVGSLSRSGIDTRSEFPPAAHTHGNMSNAGAIGTTADLAVVTGTSGVLTTQSRSGIDTRTSFPNDDVTAATDDAHTNPSKLLRGGAAGNLTLSLLIVGGGTLSSSGITLTTTGATISTNGANSNIITNGATSHIITVGAGSYFRTRTAYKFLDFGSGNELDLVCGTLTVNRTITFPNKTGTVALTSDITNSITSTTTSDGTAVLVIDTITAGSLDTGYNLVSVNGLSNESAAISGISISAQGVLGASTSGNGVEGESNSGIGGVFSSNGGDGLWAIASSGTYHARFGSGGNNNRSAIERVRGWFVWFYSTFVGRLKTADITANRDWTLPDESGTIALTTSTVAQATAALGLKTATTTVAISSATAPTAGQVLTATSGTAATWQTPSGGSVAVGDITGLGTGVATALAIAANGVGGFVTDSGTVANATNADYAATAGNAASANEVPLTGVTGLGTGVATSLALAANALGGIQTAGNVAVTEADSFTLSIATHAFKDTRLTKATGNTVITLPNLADGYYFPLMRVGAGTLSFSGGTVTGGSNLPSVPVNGWFALISRGGSNYDFV